MRNINVKQEKITNRTSESFKLYLEEIRKFDKLTVDEENSLVLKVKAGDEEARQKLIKHNLRFVVSVAKQYVTPNDALEDLVNEGSIGLIKSTETFNPTKGFKFITYAVWWIRKTILMSLSENGLTIRLPHNKLTMVNKFRGLFSRLEQELGRNPSFNEMLDSVLENFDGEYDYKDVLFYYENDSSAIASLDKPINHDGEGELTLQDFIPDNTYSSPDESLISDDNKFNVNQLLKLLKNDKEREAIKLLFGLDGGTPLGLKDVGEVLGVSRERVRQIREKSLKKMKESISKIY